LQWGIIATQLPKTEATVRQAEVALRQFKEQNQVVALDEKPNRQWRLLSN